MDIEDRSTGHPSTTPERSLRRRLAGASLSLADIPVGALMYRYANLDITEELPPNVARWYASLTDREAYQAHIMPPFDDLKGRLAP
jgi:glutathione S-transferase